MILMTLAGIHTGGQKISGSGDSDGGPQNWQSSCFTSLHQAETPPTRRPILQGFVKFVILQWACESAFPESQVLGQSGNSALRHLQNSRAVRNLRHCSTTGIDKFQNCIPAAGKVRSGLTGTDTCGRNRHVCSCTVLVFTLVAFCFPVPLRIR